MIFAYRSQIHHSNDLCRESIETINLREIIHAQYNSVDNRF